ncbi:MAG: DNA-primase RepB domain-containing protein [Vicinamibacterales bacterium]
MASARARVDRQAPLRFLHVAYGADDWVAVLLKSYATGRTVQRVAPIAHVAAARFQAWLRAEQATQHANIYVSVNPITPGRRSRTRNAVRTIRHLFLDADQDAARVLAGIAARTDLPLLSYVLHSSPNRAHLFWRVRGFTIQHAEALQKQLARELGTDPAATPCTQMTRWPGFLNHKYRPGHLVTTEYRDSHNVYTPRDFPTPIAQTTARPRRVPTSVRRAEHALGRARRYLAALPPAITGQHGDLHTFRVCCRLVRGFGLDDGDALTLLTDWNRGCEPPWSEQELFEKLRHARRYGREPIGGLLAGYP